MDRVIADEAPGRPVALLSGPTFAQEIARGLPAAVVAASEDARTAEAVQDCFPATGFRVYTSDDVTGVAIGGALKNVMAIAVGFSDGLGFGNNARAALITRGLHELGRLASRLGGHPLTLAGLAGLGDLVLTCTGELSRNRQVGLALARGDALPAILGRLGHVAEGIGTARTARDLAAELGIDMPITRLVAEVLHDGKSPRAAVTELLSRTPRPERGEKGKTSYPGRPDTQTVFPSTGPAPGAPRSSGRSSSTPATACTPTPPACRPSPTSST